MPSKLDVGRTEDVRALIREVGRHVIAEDHEPLEILASRDRSKAPAPTA
jgi:hypothetical protein